MVIRNTLLQLSCIGTMLALVSGDTIPVRRAKSKSKMKKSHKDSMDSKHHITYQPKEPATPQHMNIFSMQGSKGKGTSSKGKGKGTYPVPTKGKGVEPVATKGKGTSTGNTPSKGNSKGKGKGKGNGDFLPSCSTTCSSDCIAVTDFFLVDSTNDVRLFAIQPMEFLDFDFLETFYGVSEFSIECATKGEVGSVSLSNNLGVQTTDNEEAFILAGDDNGDFFDSNFQQNPGAWTVTCQPFCGENGVGPSGTPETLSFVVGPLIPPTTPTPPAPTPPAPTPPTPTPPTPTPPSPTPPVVVSPTLSPTLDCNRCQTGCINVIDFVLVDAASNMRVRSLVPGETIPISETEQYTIACITDPGPFMTVPFQIGSTILTDNFGIDRNVENNPPFALADDNLGDYNASPFFENPGNWEVTCQAFCGQDGSGESSPLESIRFTIESVPPLAPTLAPVVPSGTLSPIATPLNCDTCKAGCIDVIGFNLVNAATDEFIRELVPGETLPVSATDQFAIECITTPGPFSSTPFPIGSTFLTDNYDESSGNSENGPPFSLADDNNGDYFPSPLFENPGNWVVTCQAFCERNQGGISSPLRSITFDVVQA